MLLPACFYFTIGETYVFFLPSIIYWLFIFNVFKNLIGYSKPTKLRSFNINGVSGG
jgi:hypothetical protein